MNFIDLFGSGAFDIKIQQGFAQDTRDNAFPVLKFAASSVHSGGEYSIEIGTNEYPDKHGFTLCKLSVDDDETGSKKELAFTMHGGAEREILIGLFKAAAAVLEGNELKFVPQKRENEV